MRKKPEIEAEASEGQVAGKVLGARAFGSFRGWVTLLAVGWWGGPINHQGPLSFIPKKPRLRRKGMWAPPGHSYCSFKTRSGVNSSQNPQTWPLGWLDSSTGNYHKLGKY